MLELLINIFTIYNKYIDRKWRWMGEIQKFRNENEIVS